MPGVPGGICHLALSILPPGNLAHLGRVASKWAALLIAPLLSMAQEEEGLEPFSNETMRFLRMADKYITETSYAARSTTSSSSTAAPPSRAAASSSSAAPPTLPPPPKILQLEFYQLSGGEAHVKKLLASIKQARQALADV